MLEDALQRVERDFEVFGVHRVLGRVAGLYGQERARADMQGHFGCRMAFGPESSDHLWREMQPGRRSGDRSLEPGVDRLVAAVVQLLALAAEVRRDRNPSELLE